MSTHSPRRLSFDKSKEFTRAMEAIVPGGAHTYSRGRDQFPINSPSGITKGDGARLWDADGNCLLDWTMGLFSVSLGHAHPAVTQAVCAAIQDGVNFQRPSRREYETARLWVETTGQDMVKFARHGSSVTTAAVKLSRGFTGRTRVAVPAEHPFFSFDDWFIGSTACDFGIPEELKKFTLKFRYNDLDSLHALFREHPGDIACVIMEPVKFDPPADGFLEGVRELCTKNGTVLILDEMISGLKFGYPGAQTRFGVKADITTWGKGIGNGFPIAALTGRGDIMRLGGLEPEGERKLFLLSSTHGAEMVGLAALRATVEHVRDNNVVDTIWATGAALRARLDEAITAAGLGDHLALKGYDPLLALDMRGPAGDPDPAFTTLMMQEMIARGVLFQGIFMVTPSHGAAETEQTVAAFRESLDVYKQALAAGTTEGLLEGPAVRPVFRRYN